MTKQSPSIIIIDDEKPLAHALRLKLEYEGFVVAVAANGQQGLDLIDKNKFDVALVDLMMPVMDGFQLLEQLRKRTQKPIIFILSNLGQRADEEHAVSLGARKFFVKSDTSLTTVVDEIKELFQAPEQRIESR